MTMQDAAIETNSLILLAIMGSQVAEVKWQHLPMRDKVCVFTVKGSRVLSGVRML